MATVDARFFYKWQAVLWFLALVGCAILAGLIWSYSRSSTFNHQIENAPISPQVDFITELVQPTKIENLQELNTDVQPINFDTVIRDLRKYPDQFKDKRYLLANKGKWTVQVMNVAENSVITDYLSGRDDSNRFAYFRYRDENNQPRYMLIYDIMNSPQEALQAAQVVNFSLPANVRVLPEEINRYLNIIDNYERAEPIQDFSVRSIREVRLQPTKREVPAKRVEPEPAPSEDSIRGSLDMDDTLSVNKSKSVVDNKVDDGKKVATSDDVKNNRNRRHSNRVNKMDTMMAGGMENVDNGANSNFNAEASN